MCDYAFPITAPGVVGLLEGRRYLLVWSKTRYPFGDWGPVRIMGSKRKNQPVRRHATWCSKAEFRVNRVCCRGCLTTVTQSVRRILRYR